MNAAPPSSDAPPRRRRSLTTRYLLTLLMSVTLPLVAFGWWVRDSMRERLEQRIVDVYLPELAQNAADRVIARLEQASKTAAALATAARLAFESPIERQQFADQLSLLPDVHEDFQVVLLVAPDGRVVHTFTSQRLDQATAAARRPLLPDRVDATTPGGEWFERAIVHGSHWQDRHLSPFLHRAEAARSRDPTDYSLGLAYAVPTADGRSGVLYALLGWSQVQQELERTVGFLKDAAGFASAQVFLADAEGTLLAHTDRSSYGRKLAPAALLQRVLEAPRGETPFVDADGADRVAGFASVDDPRGFRWKIGIHATADELFAASAEFAGVLAVALIALVVVLIAWSRFAAATIARPVRRLAVATEAVARGDLTVRVPVDGADELANLGRAFNRMAGDLAVSRDQLRDAERQAAWAEMARQVAHEIKNPLTPMRMSAQLVLRARRDGDARLPELVDRLAKTVIDQTEALNRIASDFRQFAGPPERRTEIVRADDLLDAAAASFAGVAAVGGVTITFAPTAGDAQVEVDRQELGRVFLNLIQNAQQACGVRGTIRVTSRVDGDRCKLTVEDDGPGIPADVRARLFEPYFTTRSSGTGLGLAICRRIVQAHGGAIVLAASAPGRTVFEVELPLAGIGG